MGTMKNQMEKVGFQLSPTEEKKVKESLTTLKKKLKTSTCRKCGEKIKFVPDGEGKIIPHNLDGSTHWQTCPYSGFAQRKAATDIMKKLSVLFILKYGLNLEQEAGLNKTEVQIVHATLERIFKEETNSIKEQIENSDDGKVDDEVQFKPEPCDSVGDPDEERAPDEHLVHELEEKIGKEVNLDKGVEKVISESINELKVDKIPEGTVITEEK